MGGEKKVLRAKLLDALSIFLPEDSDNLPEVVPVDWLTRLHDLSARGLAATPIRSVFYRLLADGGSCLVA